MKHLRSYFPALSRQVDGQNAVYFDGPGGAQMPLPVAQSMSDYLLNSNANHGSQFATGAETVEMVAKVRAKAEVFLNADANEVNFGHNMTSLTLAFSRALAETWQAGDQIILSAMDHDANITPWILAAKAKAVEVIVLPYDAQTCSVNPADIEAHLNDRTRLIAVTASSNVLGSHVDIKAISKLAKQYGSLLYVDAVHHAPHYKIDVKEWGCDFLVCSAYKFFGPHVSMLYGKYEHMSTLRPFKIDPSPEETPHCWETGTQNFEGIAGLGATFEYLLKIGGEDNQSFEASYDLITDQSA